LINSPHHSLVCPFSQVAVSECIRPPIRGQAGDSRANNADAQITRRAGRTRLPENVGHRHPANRSHGTLNHPPARRRVCVPPFANDLDRHARLARGGDIPGDLDKPL
jgi:hypothetical protein